MADQTGISDQIDEDLAKTRQPNSTYEETAMNHDQDAVESDKLNVLIVDDEEDIRMLLQTMLQEDYGTKVCGSASEAMGLLSDWQPDLILSDYSMPGASGIDLIRQLHEQHLDIPVILLTGYGSKEVAIEAVKAGAFDFLEKPAPLALLRQTMAKAADMVISERRLQEAQSRSIESERLATIGIMASSIIHEIANPLAIISATGKLLTKQAHKLTPEKIIEQCDKIEKMVRRSTRLTQSLRNLSRKGAFGQERVQLEELLNDATTLCQPTLKTYQVELRIPEALGKDLQTFCDRVEVSQVFVNLINNACHALEGQKDSWVSIQIVRQDASGYTIEVTDSGGGIPDQVADKMFEIFFTTKPVGKGTGLGLATSKRILKQNFGDLTYVRGRANTTFEIQLPSFEAAQKAAEAVKEEEKQKQQQKQGKKEQAA